MAQPLLCFVFSQVWSRTSTSLWLERRASRRLYNLKCSGSLHHVVKCLRLEHLCIELAVTHLGYFLKVASEKLISCVFPYFSGAAVFVLKLAFVAFPCSKWCFNKALNGHLQFLLSVLASSWACFCSALDIQFLRCRWCNCDLDFVVTKKPRTATVCMWKELWHA